MGQVLSGSIRITGSITDARTQIAGALPETGTRAATVEHALSVATGVAAGQYDRFLIDTRSVAASSNDDVDIVGVLNDSFGATVTLVKMKLILILAALSNVSLLTVSRQQASPGLLWLTGTTPGFAPIGAGGFVGWADPATGVTSTAATADLIRVANGAGGTATYSL